MRELDRCNHRTFVYLFTYLHCSIANNHECNFLSRASLAKTHTVQCTQTILWPAATEAPAEKLVSRSMESNR